MQTEPQYVFTFLGFHALVLLAGLCIIFLGVLHRFWWNVLREFVSATIQKLLFINCYIIIWIVILCKSFVQVLRIGGMRVYRQNGCSVSNTKISYETSLLEIQLMHLYVTELVWNFIGQSIPTNASNSGWASSCQTFCFSLGFFRFPFSTVFLS